MTLIKSYFSLLEKYKAKYGDTFLLMQVGSFYEVYSTKDNDPDMLYFSKLCDLKIAQKNEYFMAGFRDYMIDKYIQKLNETSYTTVLFNQEEKGGIIERNEFAIYSPGTTFIEDEVKLSNNISCIWIHQSNQIKNQTRQIVFGVSNIDIYTGKTNVFEYEQLYYHNPSTYDNIENFISIYNPIEIILIYSDEETIDSIIHYIGIKSKKIVKICINQETALSKQASLCESQHYQNEIIKTFYSISKSSFVDSLFEKGIAFQSFCFLLNYVFEHNPSLTNKIAEPLVDNQNNNLLLANHSLKQLNILESEYNGSYSSVMKLLNTCRTSVGKRYMNHILLNPIKQVELLEDSYALIEHALSKQFVCCLQIKDIEKIIRKIIHKKASPSDYYHLYECGEILLDIFLELDKRLKDHIEEERTLSDIKIIKKHLSTFFNLDVCKQINSLQFDKYENIDDLINKGVNIDLDIALQTKIENKEKLDAIISHLNGVYTFIDKKCKDAIKVHDTSSGSFLTITKKRCESLKKHFKNREITISFISSYSKKEERFLFSGDLIYSEYNSTTCTIQSEQINQLFKSTYSSNDIYMKILNETYEKMYETASCFFYDKIVGCIRKLDLLNTKCELATMYKYCRPTIQNQYSEKSFAKMKGLRHALIEHIEKNELYVTNDIDIGTETQGILLFGTNAVGKTSLIKSIGICIIMAQAGLYVPCDSMAFYPYEYLFTRIIGNDNIFKGLSTFGVEMSELRVILNKCNKNSLILGDELCSGTEIDSALSIFTAGLETMYDKGSSFIFATHFHQIQYFQEIKDMTNVSLKHLRVKYNHELKKLVYDRKLADGAGESIYGLEVCKSLHLPDDFLKRAYEIRGKYIEQNQGTNILSLKTSAHNREKVRGICEICKKNIGTEIHHLQYQRNADKDGYIKHFHKNHLANLVSICESCHTNIHDTKSVFEKRKTLDGEIILGII
jgi:DNA mismatch repair protein MutS